ncbi:MAG: Gfo/Idh/MocA family oxidoreductase [Verrucomicrobia bacterium]|nr:Gfo/Idh/MocA family oxidoreductase [Verrucomicrobiota bacterium]
MTCISRRHFLKTTALTSAAAASWPARSWAQVAGSNSDIRLAVVGCGGRGGDHIGSLGRVPGVRLAAFCDADMTMLRNRAGKRQGVKVYQDIRRMLDDGAGREIDVVSIATPNHWHALGAIWAIQAGKDVYLEKPVSHNVSEGRRIVEFAAKYRRIVQTGTQSRSSLSGIKRAVEYVRSGKLGKVLAARGICYKPRGSIGKVDGPQPIPEGVDYDLWCGPALKLPLMRKRLHYDWHWVYNTGNGDLGNQGIHEMDVARWFLGQMELSPRVVSVGGRLGYVDDGDTANTQVIFHAYAGAPLIFEVRGLPAKAGGKQMDTYQGARIGIVVDCEGGRVVVPSYTSATLFDKDGKKIEEFKGAEDHYANFIKAVQSRNPKHLNADILEGHLSSALCHTGNISHFLGTTKRPGEIREALQADPAALEAVERMLDHLAANRVDLNVDRLTLGMPLRMNPQTEQFLDNPKANDLLTRPYRAGYVVPAKA